MVFIPVVLRVATLFLQFYHKHYQDHDDTYGIMLLLLQLPSI